MFGTLTSPPRIDRLPEDDSEAVVAISEEVASVKMVYERASSWA